MRVILLTHYYPPEVGAPQARIAALANGLRDRGVTVAVHTCFPNYPDGMVRPPYRNRPWLVEDEAGIRVVRSAVYPAPNRGFTRRIVNHASFALSAAVTAPLAGRADAVVVESPPLLLAGTAIAYARAKGASLVVHVADLWPDSAVELGVLRRPRMISAARVLERACYQAAAAIACPTEGIEAALSGRSEAGSKVRRIAPSVDTERFEPRPRPTEGRFRLLYAGTVGMSQGVETLVSAAALLEDQGEVEITIAGDGAEAPALRERLARSGPGNVRMIGAVSPDKIPALYAEMDAAVVLLRDLPLFRGALPTKMLEAMSAGRPVVLSAAGEAAKLVSEAGCGVVVPPERPDALARALADLAGDRAQAERLGAAGRRLATERFARRRAVDEWLDLLERVAPTSSRSAGA